jgi:signal peptidase II
LSGSARAAGRAGVTCAVVLALDQATKAVVRSAIPRGDEVQVVPGVVELVHTRNTGVAFGALAGGGAIVSVVIAVALGALLAFFATHADRPLIWLPTGMLLGGALGNVVDRVRIGGVTDFVKLPAWPAFNVADAAITVGVVVLVFVLERRDGARRPA